MLKGLGVVAERAVLAALRRTAEAEGEAACIKRSESEQSSIDIEVVGTVASDEGLIQRYIGIVQSLEAPSNAEEVAASVKSRGARRASVVQGYRPERSGTCHPAMPIRSIVTGSCVAHL